MKKLATPLLTMMKKCLLTNYSPTRLFAIPYKLSLSNKYERFVQGLWLFRVLRPCAFVYGRGAVNATV